MCYNTGVAQGYSSAGRVPVSKTVGRGFESSCPCHVVWSKSIRTRKTAGWKAKRRKTGDFERFLPFFSSLLFFEKIPIHFAIFSDRKDLNPRKRDFQKKRNRIEQPKGLELATRFQPFRLFVVFTECLQIVDYKINPSELGEDLNPRCAQKQKLQNNSISPPVGFEPTKAQNLFVISLFSGLSGIGVVLCVVTGGDENEKDDR